MACAHASRRPPPYSSALPNTSSRTGICRSSTSGSYTPNPLDRLNKEIQRQSNVPGIFPTPQPVIRLVGAILLEQDDEWVVAERRYFSAESMKQLTAPTLPATAQEICARPTGHFILGHFVEVSTDSAPQRAPSASASEPSRADFDAVQHGQNAMAIDERRRPTVQGGPASESDSM